MKVLIVEDDRKLASFLARVLVGEGYVADVCGTGNDAIERARSALYDLMVLDWMLPDVDGLFVCKELRQSGASIPILMLTARGELRERVLGLESGADDYLVKPFEIDEFLARVRALLRRAGASASVDYGVLKIDRLTRRVVVGDHPIDLTSREYALLVHFALNPNRVVTKTELLASVWETQFDPESNVVEVHVSRLRDKLGEHSSLISTVRGFGYRFRSKSSPP